MNIPTPGGAKFPISESLKRQTDSSNISTTSTPGVSGAPAAYLGSVSSNDAVCLVSEALAAYDGKGTTDDEDELFGAHGALIKARLSSGDLREVCNLWATKIEPLVASREIALGRPIHKGAPLYNTGLAYFVGGDFDSALRYFVAADKEDVQHKRAHNFRVLAGDHPLSKEVIINPIMAELAGCWVQAYDKVCGRTLDAHELINLLLSLASRPSDCLQAIVAMHRIRVSLAGIQNYGTLVVRFRALADLLHLIESFLRQFQNVSGELGVRLQAVLNTNLRARSAYNSFGSDLQQWLNTTRHDPHSPNALNWISVETSSRIAAAPDHGAAAGIATYFCHKYRNSLLHVNEEALDIFNSAKDSLSAAGYIVSMLRLCMYAKQGTFNTL